MRKKNQLLKKTFKLLLISFLFYNCSNEYDIKEQTLYENSIKSKTITFNDFKLHPKAYNKFSEIKNEIVNNNLLRTNDEGNNLQLDFNIDVTKIIHYEYENLESFTIPIIRNEYNGLIENLVINKSIDNKYYAKIIKYNLTPNEKTQLLNNNLTFISNPIITEYIGEVNHLHRSEICGYETIQVITSCGSGQHNGTNILEWHNCTDNSKPSLKTITIAVYCDDNLGSGGLIGYGEGGIYGNPFYGGGPNEGYITPSFPNNETPVNLYENGITTPILSNSIYDGLEDNSNKKFKCLKQEHLTNIFPNSSQSNRQLLVNYIKAYAHYFDIDTNEELAHFLGQVGAESGGLAEINPVENLNYTTTNALKKAYEIFKDNNPNQVDPTPYLNNPTGLANLVYCCKYGNGDEASGDGFKYSGRGLIQLTWKGNYQGYENYMNSIGLGWFYTGPEDLGNPDGLHATLSAMWYFKDRVLNKITIDNNTTADNVTKHINKYTDKSSKLKRNNFTNLAKQNLIVCPK